MSWRTIFKIKRKLRPFDVTAKLEAELEAKDQPRKKHVTRHEQPLQVLNVDVANTGPESPAPRDAESNRCKHGCKQQTLPFPGEIPANFGNVQFELELPEKCQKSLFKDRDSKQCVTEINRDSEAGPSSRPDFQKDRVSLTIDEPLKPETVEMVTADVQTGPELEEDYREYRNLMDRDCSMQVIPAQLWEGLGVSTSTHQRDVISREAQTTQTVYHMRSSHIEIVENVTTLDNDKRTENRPRSSKEIVSEPTSRSPSKESEDEKYSDVRPSRSTDSLKRRDSWDNKPDDQPEYTDEPCICRPGFPPRGICAFWRDKPPVRTKRPVKMDYCTRLLFWLFFLLKLAILLCIWFLLIYGFFFTGGYIYKNPEPIVPIKDLNTYLDPEEGAKNFIINNSRDSVHILITFNGPFKFNLRTHLKNHFNIQYERWYINNSDFDPNNLKRPEWPSEELRYPKWEVTMTNQSANWLIEVQHRSALMTYTVTNTSSAWYWKVEDVNWFHQNYYTVSYTHTTAVYAYRINYTSFPMDSYDLIKKHRLYNYNFNVFSKNHNYSQRFEDFRTSPGRKHTHDKILANGTSDDELTFIYVLRYVLNMTDMNMTDPSLLSGSNGTSMRFRNWEPVYSTKKDLLNFTSILNSSIRWNPMAIRARKLPPWDASNIESHPQRNQYLEEVGAELEEGAPRGRRAGDDSSKSLLVPFTMRLVYGTDKRYTTTTTTFPPPKVVKANEGIKWLGYLLAGALFLLLFQADLMAMYYIIAVAVISLVSYLGVREPLMLEQFMRLDEVIMMLYCMLLVIFLSETGLYGFLAHHIHKFFNDRVYLLMVLLCTSTVAVTTYLTNNIVTIIFMTPLGIRCSEEYDLNPVPVLIMMIVYANYAGVMTPMSSYTTLKIWQDPNFPNNDVFDDTKNLFWMFLPMFAAVMALTTLYFTLIFLILKPHLYKSTTLAAFDHERVLWQRMYAAIVPASGNNIAIRREIRREIIILENQMKMVEHRLYANPQREPVPPIVRVPEEITIRKKCLLVKIIISFIFFVLYSKLLARKVCLKTDPETNESSLCFEKMSFGWIVWVSLGILIIIIKPNWNFMMRRVDWASIVAFMALYVIEHVLVLLHIPEWFFEKMPPENSLVTVGLLTKLFWYSAGTTAILNGIVAIAMWLKYAVIFLGNTETVDAAIEIFTIILTQGVNMGGALTLISSPVGIVCANAARQQGYNIGFLRYMLYAVPITLINLIVLYSYYVPSDIQIRDKGRRIIRTTTIATSGVTAASTERA